MCVCKPFTLDSYYSSGEKSALLGASHLDLFSITALVQDELHLKVLICPVDFKHAKGDWLRCRCSHCKG